MAKDLPPPSLCQALLLEQFRQLRDVRRNARRTLPDRPASLRQRMGGVNGEYRGHNTHASRARTTLFQNQGGGRLVMLRAGAESKAAGLMISLRQQS